MRSSAPSPSCASKPIVAGVAPVTHPLRIRKSRNKRWRAGVLIFVHLLIAIHLGHWLATGSTISPLEPSEAMEFSKHSVINAGFVFFALMILSTLILGRWFCGWACHVVALQDLALWAFGKVGLKPQPVRLGILTSVPVIAFLYMFVLPLLPRFFGGAEFPATVQLTTTTFWATFPSWVPGLLTLLGCGGAMIYLMGGKAFCTYGCPYGAIFGAVDQFAPLRIRVTDACEGCGHCTAVCTSNVRVHQEVRDFGMVVDPGCMKCLDCVSVCPKQALYYGSGRPAILAQRRTSVATSARHADSPAGSISLRWLLTAVFTLACFALFMGYDGAVRWYYPVILSAVVLAIAAGLAGKSQRLAGFGLGAEVLAAAVFLVAMFVFRGLYLPVPFLFALGLSGMASYLGVCCLRILRRRNFSLRRRVLKHDGRLAAGGFAFLAMMGLLFVFFVHSSVVQYHTWMGRRFWEQTQRLWAAPIAVTTAAPALAAADAAKISAARYHIGRADHWALLRNPYDQLKLARLKLLEGHLQAYEQEMVEVIRQVPGDAALPLELGDYYASQSRTHEALEMYRTASRQSSAGIEPLLKLGRLAAASRDFAEAESAFQQALLNDPDNAVVHFNLGVLAALRGRNQEAVARFEQALSYQPDYIEARENLAGMYCSMGRFQEGAEQFKIALEHRPDDPDTHTLLAQALLETGQWQQAEHHLARSMELAPDRAAVQQLLNRVRFQFGDLGRATLQEQMSAAILEQAIGRYTLATFNLPAEFLARVVDRRIRAAHRERFHRVAGHNDSPAREPMEPLGNLGDRIERQERRERDAVQRYRRSLPSAVPPLRGYRAPILEQSEDFWPLSEPPESAGRAVMAATDVVARRLARDGLLPTLARVLEILGPARFAERETSPANSDVLRGVGLPVDLLQFFPPSQPTEHGSIVGEIASRIDAGQSAAALGAELRARSFAFRPTNPGFRVATESGENDIAMLRMQVPDHSLWSGSGSVVDMADSMVRQLPEAEFMASVHQADADAFTHLAASWSLRRAAQLLVISEPDRLAQWAQDNGKAGTITDRESSLQQVATLVPRYASQQEAASVLAPNDSFLMDGLAQHKHPVVQSPLLFQGGNLLAARDPVSGRRLLFVGEAEIVRNTALGLTHDQVVQAFTSEFAVDDCVVLPAVSFHIDMDVTFRAHGGRLLAFVNDPLSAAQIVVELGIAALQAGGVIEGESADHTRTALAGGQFDVAVSLIEASLQDHIGPDGAYSEACAAAFALGSEDSTTGHFERFLVALDILSAASESSPRLPAGYLAALQRNAADHALLGEQLRNSACVVVAVPGWSEADGSISYVNGLHDRTHYFMPTMGGEFSPLDRAAAAVFQRELSGVAIVPVPSAATQRRAGALHCCFAAYPLHSH